MNKADEMLGRARGCLFGQVIGDSLGGLVEFMGADEIARNFPDGVRDLQDGGTWGLMAGQPTDDSEMALALARSIAARGGVYERGDLRRVARGVPRGGVDSVALARGGAQLPSGSGRAAHDASASRDLLAL